MNPSLSGAVVPYKSGDARDHTKQGKLGEEDGTYCLDHAILLVRKCGKMSRVNRLSDLDETKRLAAKFGRI